MSVPVFNNPCKHSLLQNTFYSLSVIHAHDRKGVISAKTRIDVIVDSARQREPFTHFLSIPLNNSKMQDRFAEFKTDVLRECDGVGRQWKIPPLENCSF